MRKILQDLWHGNLIPQEKFFKRGTSYDKALGALCKSEEILNRTLDGKGKEAYEKFCDYRNEIASYAEEESFINGFRLGARIIMESFYENDGFFSALGGIKIWL